MRPVHFPSFLHHPASRRNNLIASICVNCHRYIAAGDLELLNNVERQHVCVKKPAVSYRPTWLSFGEEPKFSSSVTTVTDAYEGPLDSGTSNLPSGVYSWQIRYAFRGYRRRRETPSSTPQCRN